jgi:hypothetical protein
VVYTGGKIRVPEDSAFSNEVKAIFKYRKTPYKVPTFLIFYCDLVEPGTNSSQKFLKIFLP